MNPPAPIYVLDANLLLRLASKSHPHHKVAQQAVRILRTDGAQLRTVPQAIFEFWVVATRDAKLNGLGLSLADAEVVLDALLRLFPIMPDDPALMTYWRHLIVQYGIVGKPAHDVRYIAAMQAHRITHFLTFDAGFSRYASEGITIIDPASVIAPKPESSTK